MNTGFQPIRHYDAAPPQAPPAPMKPFGDDGLTFRDLVDLVNPLHHVPLLGNLYRRFTGDVIDPAVRIAGGALFGGPIGAGFAAVSVALKHALSAPDEARLPDETRVAGNAAPPPGGWMVASARPLRFAAQPHSVAVNDDRAASRPVRRGGWIAQAAYAMVDARARADDALRARIDTIV